MSFVRRWCPGSFAPDPTQRHHRNQTRLEPTGIEYDPDEELAWTTAGGLGAGDSTSIGQIDLVADTPGQLSTSGLKSALQAMVDGAEQSFLLRRVDPGPFGVAVTAKIVVEFDVDVPPN